MKSGEMDAEVLILGAGMAGLAAARKLAAQGARVLMLEAQARIGGRILTQRAGDEIIELGAEFVHGRPPELLELIEEAGLSLIERTGSFLHHRDGTLSTEEDENPFTLLTELEDLHGPDLSFAEFLDVSAADEAKKAAAIGFVEGFNAADYRVISALSLGLQQKAEDAIEGDRSFHVAGGYDRLTDFLGREIAERGGQVRRNTRVDRIEWQPGRVVARTNQGSFAARRVVVTLPLGMLISGSVEFAPALPEQVREILRKDGPIRMGEALRFTLVFRERFWKRLPPQPAMSELSFLISSATVPAVWWTSHPEAGNALTGWVGGPRAAELAGLGAETLGERGCEVLAEIFHLNSAYLRSQLTACFSHDWNADPNSRGAYSYIAKDGLAAPGILCEPIFETIYFAGEHTATDGHWGTVHAALGSGLRVARQIAVVEAVEATRNR